MTSVGLIGWGGMAQDVVAALCGARTTSGVRIIGALARPGRGGEARSEASMPSRPCASPA